MKQQFLKLMRAVSFRGPSTQHELRDLIRIFVAGCQYGRGSVDGAVLDSELADRIADHNWWPDPSWDWSK